MKIFHKTIVLGAAVILFSVSLVSLTKADTISDLQARIDALRTQISQLLTQQSSSGVLANCTSITFSRTLKLGSSGSDVKCLQTVLNQDVATRISARGVGSPGQESTYFGRLTQQALIRFQQKYAAEILIPSGLSRGNGTVDVATAIKLKALSSIALAPASVTPVIQPLTTTAAIAKVNPSVVSIVVSKQAQEYQVTYQDPFGNGVFQVPVYTPTGRTVSQPVGAGSGFLISADGYLLTNNHVIVNPQYTYTANLTTGASQVASVMYQDPSHDVAILKIEGSNYAPATLGDSDSLQLGQSVIAIGNALGQFSNTVSVGIVSGLNRTIQAKNDNDGTQTLIGVIQTDAAINPGNSGGPLLDLNGNVVGINVATVQGSSNISFALPINPVKTIVHNAIGR